MSKNIPPIIAILLLWTILAFSGVFAQATTGLPGGPQATPQFYALHNMSAKNIAIARNTQDNTLLAVYDQNLTPDYGVDADNKVYAQLLNPDGSPNGLPHFISDLSPEGIFVDSETPNVHYNAARHEFVIFISEMSREMPRPVVQDSELYRQYCYDIVAVRVSVTGERVGSQLVVSNATDCQWQPVAAYDPERDRYLVNWHDFRNSPDYPLRPPTDVPKKGKDIYARFVGYNAAGELANQSDEFLLSYDGNDPTDPAIAYQDVQGMTYNPDRKEFVALWSDERDVPDQTIARECPYRFWERMKKFQIYGQIIRADGTLAGPNFALFRKITGVGGGRHEKPNLTYNPFSQRYLALFLQQNLPPYPPCQNDVARGGSDYLQAFDVAASGVTIYTLTGWTAKVTDRDGRPASILHSVPVSGFYPYGDVGCKTGWDGACLVVWMEGTGARKLVAAYTDSRGNRKGQPFNLFTAGDAKVPKIVTGYANGVEHFVVAFVNRGQAYSGRVSAPPVTEP
ncbi:MAG: hypothetical protein IT330_17480, partial [Anaerolineae bacterium]|nr:hypothetical protein [Anaerolineae bacterium]